VYCTNTMNIYSVHCTMDRVNARESGTGFCGCVPVGKGRLKVPGGKAKSRELGWVEGSRLELRDAMKPREGEEKRLGGRIAPEKIRRKMRDPGGMDRDGPSSSSLAHVREHPGLPIHRA
jgi:hypothetical protein